MASGSSGGRASPSPNASWRPSATTGKRSPDGGGSRPRRRQLHDRLRPHLPQGRHVTLRQDGPQDSDTCGLRFLGVSYTLSETFPDRNPEGGPLWNTPKATSGDGGSSGSYAYRSS